jgi:hypothetical protein
MKIALGQSRQLNLIIPSPHNCCDSHRDQPLQWILQISHLKIVSLGEKIMLSATIALLYQQRLISPHDVWRSDPFHLGFCSSATWLANQRACCTPQSFTRHRLNKTCGEAGIYRLVCARRHYGVEKTDRRSDDCGSWFQYTRLIFGG